MTQLSDGDCEIKTKTSLVQTGKSEVSSYLSESRNRARGGYHCTACHRTCFLPVLTVTVRKHGRLEIIRIFWGGFEYQVQSFILNTYYKFIIRVSCWFSLAEGTGLLYKQCIVTAARYTEHYWQWHYACCIRLDSVNDVQSVKRQQYVF